VSAKKSVLKTLKNAFCVKMEGDRGYIVWPGKMQPRGFEQPAIGVGGSAAMAWRDARKNIFPKWN
jgi:hypothetical protein